MATITSFEELDIWKRGHRIALRIYELTNQPELQRDFGLKDQMRRCAISVTSNIAEGFARQGDREFRYFLNVAKGSCIELRSQLYLARDLRYISEDDFDYLNQELITESRMIGGLIHFLTKQPKSRT